MEEFAEEESKTDTHPGDLAQESSEGPDRQTQPVDAEAPPRLPFPVVGIGASAGGLEAFSEFLKAMPADGGMAYVLVQHLPPDRQSMLTEILGKRTTMPVREVADGMAVEVDHVYVIRPGHVLTIHDGHLHLGPKLDGPRAANRPVDDFFKSLAEEQRERAIAIIMSGMGSNGSAGAQMVKAVGGLCIAQEPESAEFASMPRHLIDSGNADYILRPSEMPDVLLAYAGHPYTRGGRELGAAALLRREQVRLQEILTVLRTRTRQDFAGYKKPTVLRRVQRRMGLTRVTDMVDYVKLLRQSPAEVTALSDDLLIHVTGFFRDPESWEALRERVIIPLVASREPESQVRCWVTACSTGDEAYTLAMLLVEESEQAYKRLDIKVFATDMAERTLLQARAGVYPGGIESEISPERLARFFNKEDAVYRVRPDLRERVVFAPQNVLQDPPFSRLDIATCRNLLIYLEPEVQVRVLGLLHFGLREGGALFLGSSETISSTDGMFEAIDKKAKIFRRIGPTRHGSIEFPLPHAIRAAQLASPTRLLPARPPGPGPTYAMVTQRALLEHHLPVAVLVDRDYRIQYYQGDTPPFLATPRGEPTRDLMELVVEGLRGAVRVALRRAAAENAAVTVYDGWIETLPRRQSQVTVTASPVNDPSAPDHLVVSFELRQTPAAEGTAGGNGEPGGNDESGGDGDGKNQHADGELRRIREELQSTIEELQTSNEEMKAAAEEASSMNEELQSSNEELETSKEEMQSLNEELNTVNAQLQARMAEHQATGNDLASLLASTDIAVLFLDPSMRIRRFTPPVRDLFDLLASDVGRPLSDFARKFTDLDLVADAQAVLERLIPIESEIVSAAGKWFQRRITPYRTIDDRIDGVVVTFVDITRRKHAEDAVNAAREDSETIVSTLHEPLVVLRNDLTVSTANDAFYQHFKISPGESIGRKIYELGNHQWNIPELRTALEEVLPANKVLEDHRVIHEFHHLGRRVMLLNGRRLDHQKLILLGVRDITEQHDAEQIIRASEERLRRMVNVSGVGILTFDMATGVLLDSNDAFIQMTGYTREQLTRRELTWRSMTPLEHTDNSLRQMQAVSQAGRLGPYEKEYFRQDGSRVWMLLAGASLGDGTVIEYCIDISDRKRAEQAVREGEERFRLLVEGARDFAMLLEDAEGRVTAWNIGAERLLGYTEAEAVGRPGALIYTDEDQAAGVPEQELAEAREKGRAVDERWHVRKGGVRFWGSGAMSALRNADGSVRGFVKVLRDETARKRAEDAMQLAKETAELTNRAKDEFLATLSHELRTPLSAILIWSKMLASKGRPPDPEELAEGLAAIQSSAEAQKTLIEDLLDTSRITSGKLRLQLRRVDLVALIREAVDAVLPGAEAKGVEVAVDLDTAAGEVMADPDRLRQVIWNLLSNAVKFTPPGGRVDVGLWRRGSGIEIRVVDTGQGIDPDFVPKLFSPFTQMDGSSTRRHGGLGLGLAICKQLVELHGGTIHAESAGRGKGSTFVVLLPLPQRRGGKAAADDLSASPTPEQKNLTGISVLLVEDDPDNRNAMIILLRRGGAGVTAVESAAAALEAIARSRPDVLLSDIGLPGMDGYELLRRLRDDETAAGLAPIPAIAVTAFAQDQERRRGVAVGFQYYLSKPVDPDELLAGVRSVVTSADDSK